MLFMVSIPSSDIFFNASFDIFEMKVVNIEYENNLREKAYWKEYNLEFDKNWNSQIQHQYKVKQPLIL